MNPVIAVLLGATLAGERVSPSMAAAGAVTLGGVVLLTLPSRGPKRA